MLSEICWFSALPDNYVVLRIRCMPFQVRTEQVISACNPGLIWRENKLQIRWRHSSFPHHTYVITGSGTTQTAESDHKPVCLTPSFSLLHFSNPTLFPVCESLPEHPCQERSQHNYAFRTFSFFPPHSNDQFTPLPNVSEGQLSVVLQ